MIFSTFLQYQVEGIGADGQILITSFCGENKETNRELHPCEQFVKKCSQ